MALAGAWIGALLAHAHVRREVGAFSHPREQLGGAHEPGLDVGPDDVAELHLTIGVRRERRHRDHAPPSDELVPRRLGLDKVLVDGRELTRGGQAESARSALRGGEEHASVRGLRVHGRRLARARLDATAHKSGLVRAP
jgi:hypothetical protein